MDSSHQSQAEGSTLLTVSDDPVVRESSIISLDSRITPTERFYVRNHFEKVPDLDADSWRLKVDGLVDRPLDLSLDQILALPSAESVITLECAGNSRSYLTPPAEGISFKHGAVSTASWKGVPLALVLEKAGVKAGAKEVVFQGADAGEEEEDGVVYSTDLPYCRSLPLDTAQDSDVLLAYEMNGTPLTRDHGFPLRLVVPRWYGMASVKWLTSIQVVDIPFDGFFQKRRYVFIDEGTEDKPERKPVTTLQVKSIITSPRHGEVIQPGPFVIKGFAWSGEGDVTRVEATTDGGQNWSEARLLGESTQNCWRGWEFDWSATRPGHYIFMARATDSAGIRQPKSVSWNFRGYANNGIHTLAVEVPAT